VLGHIGRVVCPQAAENLTPPWFSHCRTKATHGEVTQRYIKSINKCFMEKLPLNIWKLAILLIQATFLYSTWVIKSPYLLGIYFDKKNLHNFEACLMYKLWPLLHRIVLHTAGSRVHTLIFIICFSNDEVT
jgi:hypothetical protein